MRQPKNNNNKNTTTIKSVEFISKMFFISRVEFNPFEKMKGLVAAIHLLLPAKTYESFYTKADIFHSSHTSSAIVSADVGE